MSTDLLLRPPVEVAPGPSTSGGGSALGDARRAAGLSIAEVARRMHVSRPTVSMWEVGSRGVARHHWPALARALQVPLAELSAMLGGSPPGRLDGVRLASLATVRRSRGLTQRELADRLDVAPTTVAMWESGGVRVPAQHVATISRIVGSKPERLMAPAPGPGPETRPLRGLRRRAGMSRREAAELVGVSVSTLSRYEAGERTPPVAVLRRMAGLYGASAVELVRRHRTVVTLPAGGVWSPDDVPRVVAALRTSAGLTKVEFGRLLGRSGQAVRTWETGRSRPGAETCRRIEARFGLRTGQLPG